jgi:aspartate aminotransferase
VLSDRIQAIKPSPTIASSMKAAERKRQGFPVISLSAGEPDFPTPEFIKEAAIAAIQTNKTRYTDVEGIPELRDAICAKLQADQGLQYDRSQICVSTGAKQSIFNLMGVLLNPGDELLVPVPYWVSYTDMALFFGAHPVLIQGDPALRYKITPERLEAAITPRSKLLMLNSPSNPSGVAYTHEELAALGEVLLRHPQVLICSDDIYEKVLWNGAFANLPMATPELSARTILINGVSKAYSMTGWRIGYAAGDVSIIKAMNKLQSQSTSNACSIAQYAALAALKGGNASIRPMVAEFKTRHDYLLREINAIPGMEMLPADGAFYAFINVQSLIQRLGLENDLAFANHLLEVANLAGVPGSAFGMEGFIRFSFATSQAELETAIARLRAAFL